MICWIVGRRRGADTGMLAGFLIPGFYFDYMACPTASWRRLERRLCYSASIIIRDVRDLGIFYETLKRCNWFNK